MMRRLWRRGGRAIEPLWSSLDGRLKWGTVTIIFAYIGVWEAQWVGVYYGHWDCISI